MGWLWVTVVVHRKAYRTCLCTVPWPVPGQQCIKECQCTQAGKSWGLRSHLVVDEASSKVDFVLMLPLFLALALMTIISESHHCVAAKLLSAPCKDRELDMMLMREQSMLHWIKTIKEYAFLTWTQIAWSAKARRGLKNVFLLSFEYYRFHELIRRILGVVGGDMRGCLCSAGTQNVL